MNQELIDAIATLLAFVKKEFPGGVPDDVERAISLIRDEVQAEGVDFVEEEDLEDPDATFGRDVSGVD